MYKITIEKLHDDYLDRPINDKKTVQNMVSDEMMQKHSFKLKGNSYYGFSQNAKRIRRIR